MAHEFGLLELPAVVPAAGESAGDPKLGKLVAFFAAAMNTWADTAWQNKAPGPNQLVQFTFTHDPQQADFVDRELPALYLWAESSQGERLADELETDKTTLVLLWIPEPVPDGRKTPRLPFLNAVAKAIRAAAYIERTPSWVDTGDTDPLAATQGSNIVARAGLLSRIMVRATNKATVTVPIEGTPPRVYDALRMELQVAESLELDPSVNTEPAAVSLDVTKSDATHGTEILVEFDDPTIP